MVIEATEATTGMTGRRRTIVAAVAILAVIVAAFLVGRDRPSTTIRHGQALSAVGTISVEVGPGTYSIPTDVAWLGADGSYRSGGRPECLPPVGIGVIDVTFATVKVKAPSAAAHDQTIWVDCTGWNPAEDLTAEQAENARIDGVAP